MDKITSLQNNIFTLFIIFSYVMYFLFALGFANNAPKYLNDLNYYVTMYISIFLLWRFNMFRKIEFNELDRKIAFSAGLFLFTTTALNQILIKYFTIIKNKIINII